jgi:hydrogenase nickel incorporation protein HypA/HybF
VHETHLIERIIQGITQQAAEEGAPSVTKVRLKVGEFMGIRENSFKETFALLAKGTVLEGAQLELTFFPGSRIEVVSFDVD